VPNPICRFVSACYILLQGNNLPESDDLWSTISTLSRDKVIDVRIGVSRLVSETCGQCLCFHLADASLIEVDREATLYPDPLKRPHDITSLIQTLSHDPSTEVRSYVLYLAVPRSPMSSRTMSTSSAPSTFAIFSKPPTTPTITEDFDDLIDDDLDADMDLDEAEAAAERLFGPQSLPTGTLLSVEFSNHGGSQDQKL